MDNFEDMSGKYLPPNLHYMVEEMSQYSRNRFRLETVSAASASAGRIVTVNLPEGALLDLSSFRFFFDAHTNSTTVANAPAARDTLYAKLPNDAQSLIQRIEVNLNGQSVQGAASEWNTVFQVKKLSEGSQDRSGSVDRALSHGSIDTVADTIEEESMCIQDWCGFLGERSTRFLDTSIWGQIQVRITMAGNHVLSPKVKSIGMGTALIDTERAAAANMSYTIDNMYFTIDSVSVNPTYNEMLRMRLSRDGYLPLFYKEQYTFGLDNITSGASSARFSLSSGSIDKIYGVYRDSNYQKVGVPSHPLVDAGVGLSAHVANAFRFRAFNGSAASKLAGNLRYQWTLNNIPMPTYRATLLDALADVSYVQDKVGVGGRGTLVASRESFNDGKFVCCQILNHPTPGGVAVKSGFNSRGINTTMTWNVSGQTVPAANTGTQETGSLSAFVVLDTTAELRIQPGRNLVVLA